MAGIRPPLLRSPAVNPPLIDEVDCCIQVCRVRRMAKTTSALSAAATGSGVMKLGNLVKHEPTPRLRLGLQRQPCGPSSAGGTGTAETKDGSSLAPRRCPFARIGCSHGSCHRIAGHYRPSVIVQAQDRPDDQAAARCSANGTCGAFTAALTAERWWARTRHTDPRAGCGRLEGDKMKSSPQRRPSSRRAGSPCAVLVGPRLTALSDWRQIELAQR